MSYRIIGHRREQPCPACKKPAFCDDCGLCQDCNFTPPPVDLPHPPPPAPALHCPECDHTVHHARTCSVTLQSLAN